MTPSIPSSTSSRAVVKLQVSPVETSLQERVYRTHRRPLHLPFFDSQYVPHGGRELVIFKATNNGDVDEMERQMQAITVDDNDVFDPDLMLASHLFNTAIHRKHCKMLDILLREYPSLQMSHISILEQAFQNPDLDIFKLLHARSPQIINMHWNWPLSTMTEACRGANPAIPEYLMDNVGRFSTTDPLRNAVTNGQPAWLIQRLIHAGAPVRPGIILDAIKRADEDILRLVVNRNPGGWSKENLKAARATGNKAIVSMVETAAKSWNEKYRLRPGGKIEIRGKRVPRKHWWQCGKK
ncbi:hypothetical protein ACLMJK_008185 [Lecanora helva]